VGREREVENMIEIGEGNAEGIPVPFAGLDEGGEFFELNASNGGLGVERLEVVAEVAVDVFVVVALGEFAELPAEAFLAGIVLAGGAPTVAAPVAKTFGVGF